MIDYITEAAATVAGAGVFFSSPVIIIEYVLIPYYKKKKIK